MIVGGPIPRGPHALTFVNYLKKEYHKQLRDIDYDYHGGELRHEKRYIEKDWKYLEHVARAKAKGEKVGKQVIEDDEIDPAAKAAKEAKLAEQEAKKAAEKAAKEAEEDDGTSSKKKK